jgi:hypothetical protein
MEYQGKNGYSDDPYDPPDFLKGKKDAKSADKAKSAQYKYVLEKEANEAIAECDRTIARLKVKIETLTVAQEHLEKTLKGKKEKSDNDFARLRYFYEEMNVVVKQKSEAEATKALIENSQKRNATDADGQFNKTKDIQKTGKNRVYIGNRQFVAGYVEGNKTKKSRTLDLGRWSWGINYAWIEGATVACAEVKIKMSEDDNPFAKIPQGALLEIEKKPKMSGYEWLKVCKKYPGTILWYTKDKEDRPSWTALEIKACLDAGYQFKIYEHKKLKEHKDKMALKLIKPEKSD